MKTVNSLFASLIFSILLHFNLYGQKLLEQQPEIRITYIDNDSTRVYSFDTLINSQISVVTYGRINEYFVSSDTLHRDYVLFGNARKTMDKLQWLQQCDYTGAYDLVECRKIENRFLIFCFVNTFFYGTNQNAFYVVFELEKNNWKYLSSYENEADKPTDNIKVICSKKGLKLKGKYLKEIKREGFDCLNQKIK